MSAPAFELPDGYAGEVVSDPCFPFALTRPALDKAAALAASETEGGYGLRLSVAAGGCSGLRYQLYFDVPAETDTSASFDGFTVICDRPSVPYLTGATVHFVDTIEKSGFVIENPNAAGSCACGDSFH
jgi:iron-sulfur cluster assembly accessory protein